MERIYEKNLVEIFRVTPNVFFRKGNLRIRHQCNGAFLVSGDTVAAVDVPSMEAAQEMMDESAELFGLPIRYVFLTHGDADHVEGLPLFLDQPVTVFCSHRLIGQIAPEGTSHKAVFAGVDGVLGLRIGALDVELSTIQGTAHSPRDM
ncbi:MAG TPA: MBL fold metallo-hydrolase, partial [Clostridia bacterium]